jgi:hypothetical protein
MPGKVAAAVTHPAIVSGSSKALRMSGKGAVTSVLARMPVTVIEKMNSSGGRVGPGSLMAGILFPNRTTRRRASPNRTAA